MKRLPILLFAALACACQPTVENIKAAPAKYKGSARKLLDEAADHKLTIGEKYGGALVEVSGSFSETEAEQKVVHVWAPRPNATLVEKLFPSQDTLDCRFLAGQETTIERLRKGDTIKVKGTFKWDGKIVLERCVVVD